MATVAIRVRRDGTAIAIGGAHFAGVVMEKHRASHVEPCNRVLRAVFHAIRRRVADTSPLAEFTRRWRCNWRVNLAPSHGPIIGPFHDRSAAIAAEVVWLTRALTTHGL